MSPKPESWLNATTIPSRQYKCGHCESDIASQVGWVAMRPEFQGTKINAGTIHICHFCNLPSVFIGRSDLPQAQIPGVPFGNPVANTPESVQTLYEEARECTSAGAYTATVMLCRKLLMHIAVEKGADTGKSFLDYVTYLADKGYVPPDGKDWVDHSRKKGNEANHEIKHMDKADAEDLIHFSEMLLKFIYEFPAKIPKKEPPKT